MPVRKCRSNTTMLKWAPAGHQQGTPSLAEPATGTGVMATNNSGNTRSGGGASSIAVIPPSLPLRPITTHINLLVVGASRSGKGAFIDTFKDVLGLTPAPPEAMEVPIGCAPDPSNPWGCFSADPSAWRTTYAPLRVPKAGRELVYSVQSAPGWGSTLDPSAWLEALVGVVMEGRGRDYAELGGARGLHKSLVCGALVHSYTAALYFLPPTGPTATDLVLMAALSQALPLVPVVGACWTAPGAQGDASSVAQLMDEVEQLLADPGKMVPGLQPGDIQLPTRPAVHPLWLSPMSAATKPVTEAPAAAGMRDAATAVSPRTVTRLTKDSLDVISVSSEDEMHHTPASTYAASAAASAGAAGAAAKEPDAADRSSSQGGGVAVEGLQKLVDLLAGQEVYCLLDASWDAYTTFCATYDIVAGQLTPLITSHLERFVPKLLAGPGAVKAQQEQEKAVKELLQLLGINIHNHHFGTIAQFAQKHNWSPAVRELCQRVVALP